LITSDIDISPFRPIPFFFASFLMRQACFPSGGFAAEAPALRAGLRRLQRLLRYSSSIGRQAFSFAAKAASPPRYFRQLFAVLRWYFAHISPSSPLSSAAATFADMAIAVVIALSSLPLLPPFSSPA